MDQADGGATRRRFKSARMCGQMKLIGQNGAVIGPRRGIRACGSRAWDYLARTRASRRPHRRHRAGGAGSRSRGRAAAAHCARRQIASHSRALRPVERSAKGNDTSEQQRPPAALCGGPSAKPIFLRPPRDFSCGSLASVGLLIRCHKHPPPTILLRSAAADRSRCRKL